MDPLTAAAASAAAAAAAATAAATTAGEKTGAGAAACEAFTDTLESVAASIGARSFSAAYEAAQRIMRNQSAAAVREAMSAHETYMLHAYSVLALLMLGMTREAAAELADVGPLDTPGAPVPFLLRYLDAVVPLQTDAKLAPDRLYALYWHCERQRSATTDPAAANVADAAEWDRRETLVLRTAAARHLALRQPQRAALALERVVALAPTDARALTELGKVHYMLGCRDECCALLAEAARHTPPGAASAALSRALRLLADGRDADALAQLQPLERSADAAVANNAAVCHMFCGELAAALGVFRAAVDAAPAAVSDATRSNMCILFDLTSSQPDVLKKQLTAQIQKAKELASL